MSDAARPATTPAPRRRRHIGLWILGVFVVAVIALVALWDWDWFLPLIDAQASSALGRKVTAQHLHVNLGRVTTVSLDGVVIAGPDADSKPFAQVKTLSVKADLMAYLHNRSIVLPQILLDHPVIEADQDAAGKGNWPMPPSSGKPAANPNPDAGPKIGQLVIRDGEAHVVLAKLKADMNLAISTRDADPNAGTPDKQAGQLVVDAKGTYAAQPITGQFQGGALLSLRDTQTPYPIDLHLQNGPTKVSITGSVQNPLNFAGANLRLDLSGPNMALLTPLTGVPIPETPAYSVAGKLDYADRKIRFSDFHGKLGESDLNGTIAVDPTQARPFVDADLYSHRVNLVDLGGFIGATPGNKQEATSTKVHQEQAKADQSGRVLPDTPLNLPKLNFANVRLRYKGEHIAGRSVPLDNIIADVDITDGKVDVHPLSFAIGTGDVALNAALTPAVGKDLKADMSVEVRHVDLARLLAATHLVNGAGTISGSAKLVGEGDSLGQLLGTGNGGLRLGMSGGDLSALLVDIAGLEFGNAILSALGIPQRAALQCFAADFDLQHGVLDTKAFVLDTSEARVLGGGYVNLSNEELNFILKTAAKHFSIGTLPTPIRITGHLKSPSIAPEAGPLAARAGAAVGLGILFPPAALLPTIQFGVGNDNSACESVERTAAEASPAAADKIPHGAAVRHAPAKRRGRR